MTYWRTGHGLGQDGRAGDYATLADRTRTQPRHPEDEFGFLVSRPEPAEWPAFEIDITAHQSRADGQPHNRRRPITFAGMRQKRRAHQRRRCMNIRLAAGGNSGPCGSRSTGAEGQP